MTSAELLASLMRRAGLRPQTSAPPKKKRKAPPARRFAARVKRKAPVAKPSRPKVNRTRRWKPTKPIASEVLERLVVEPKGELSARSFVHLEPAPVAAVREISRIAIDPTLEARRLRLKQLKAAMHQPAPTWPVRSRAEVEALEPGPTLESIAAKRPCVEAAASPSDPSSPQAPARDERDWVELELQRVAVAPRQKIIADFKAITGVKTVVRVRKNCTAVDEDTGKRCTLPEHGRELAHSASGRRFIRVLQPGAEPRREIDQWAQVQREAPIATGRDRSHEAERAPEPKGLPLNEVIAAVRARGGA